MPHIQRSSCADKGTCVSIYASYKLAAINNMTRNTGIHTFHIIGICPWTDMPATQHINVTLHCYCSLHIDSLVLHMSVEKQQTATFSYQAITIHVPAINMPLKCHTCHTYKLDSVSIGEVCQYICHVWSYWHNHMISSTVHRCWHHYQRWWWQYTQVAQAALASGQICQKPYTWTCINEGQGSSAHLT